MSPSPAMPKRRTTAGLRVPYSKNAHPPLPPEAAPQVFAIPELLEMILIEVPESLQLFELQRVNSLFKDTIARCKSLRRRMLLEHSPDRTDECIDIFLEQGGILEVTWPFEWFPDSRIGRLTIYLPGDLEPRNDRNIRSQLFPERKRDESWRRILVGLPDQVWLLRLNWLGQETPWSADVRADTRLGELVDQAEDMATVAWFQKNF